MITTLTGQVRHPLRKKHLAIIGAVAAAALLAFLIGYLPRHRAHSKLVAQTSAQQGPLRVSVVPAVAAESGRELTLPATLAPYQRTLVFARASGFVRRWLVDIGSLTAQRMHTLFQEALVAKQDDDQARTQASVWEANVKAAIADIEAMRANIRQLEQLISFGRVLAPYDGTITQRLVDVGTLVNAGAGGTGAALFEIEATNPIRAFIDVPQPFAPSVRTGADAYVTVRQFPGRKFPGKVVRTAGAIDPASRTLRTEIDLPNDKGELFAGTYGEASIGVDISHPIVRVPSGAILQDARGVHVAVVDPNGRVHLTAVQLGVDNGTTVDVVNGLKGGEQIIATPPSDAADGLQVQVVQAGAPG